MSDRARFQRLDELFKAALPVPHDERPSFLESRCADADLRAEVLELLHEDATAPDLRAPVADLARRIASGSAPAPGDRAEGPLPTIPGFRVVRLIGRGGMGEVFEAEQATPRRRVALKLIRADAASPDLMRRFELEAEFLARLDHPGIATIFQTGAVGPPERRTPYLAMEFVEGVPLTAFASEHHLSLRRRLGLFLAVCDAVRHAHERGVIHRDLKPDNILVTPDGRPKVLDFGVARAADADPRTLAARTQTGLVLGTIFYMSPEQLAAAPNSVDVQSDVYSLGVILFQLLTGRLPYPQPCESVFALMRAISESSIIRAPTLDPRLRGDLDAILTRCLAQEKAKRYTSAADLAADVRRHLASEPILARPPGTLYQLRKFAARNRALVSAIGAVFVVLIVSLALIATSLAESRRQRAIAERKSRVLAGVNSFFTGDLLAAADPKTLGGGAGVTLLDAIDRAASSIPSRFGDDPEVEAAVRETLGQAYLNLDRFDQAGVHTRRALALTPVGTEPGAYVDRANVVAMLQMDVGDTQGAVETLRPAIEALDHQLPGDYERRIATLGNLAAAAFRLDDLEEADRLFSEAADLGRARGSTSDGTISAIGGLGLIRQYLNRFDEAEALSLEAIDLYTRTLGPEHPDTLTSTSNLALLYARQGKHQLAADLQEKVLQIRRRTLGEDHGDTLISKNLLSRSYSALGRYEEAEPLALAAYNGLLARLGPDHKYTKIARSALADLYDAWGRPVDAARFKDAPGTPPP